MPWTGRTEGGRLEVQGPGLGGEKVVGVRFRTLDLGREGGRFEVQDPGLGE